MCVARQRADAQMTRVAHFGPLSCFSPKTKRKMADRSFGRGFRSPKIFRAPRGRSIRSPISSIGIRSHSPHRP